MPRRKGNKSSKAQKGAGRGYGQPKVALDAKPEATAVDDLISFDSGESPAYEDDYMPSKEEFEALLASNPDVLQQMIADGLIVEDDRDEMGPTGAVNDQDASVDALPRQGSSGIIPGYPLTLPEGMGSPGGLARSDRRRPGRGGQGGSAGGIPQMLRMPSNDEVHETLADEDERWTQTLKRAIPSVVVIQTHSLNNLEGESSASQSTGTGFVVDSRLGLVLTNRHVASIGPATLTVTFQSNEDAEARLVYVDPLHDFAFLQADLTHLSRETLPLRAIRLNPVGARVGTEVRVIGNDDAEKLSILRGTLSRVDRAAPEYAPFGFVDHLTHYLLAASATSGGSSGSPVLNVYGEAVGLNAGGSTRSSNAMYLPLYRVARALAVLQQGNLPRRGYAGAQVHHVQMHECTQLGVPRKVMKWLTEHGRGRYGIDPGAPVGTSDGGSALGGAGDPRGHSPWGSAEPGETGVAADLVARKRSMDGLSAPPGVKDAKTSTAVSGMLTVHQLLPGAPARGDPLGALRNEPGMRALGPDSGWGAPEAGILGEVEGQAGSGAAAAAGDEGAGDDGEDTGGAGSGESDARLRVGDVLLSINGRPLVSFLPLEEECDAAMERLQVPPPTSVAQPRDEDCDSDDQSEDEDGDGHSRPDGSGAKGESAEPDGAIARSLNAEEAALGGDHEATEMGASCSAAGAAATAWSAKDAQRAAAETTTAEMERLAQLASQREGDAIGALLDSLPACCEAGEDGPPPGVVVLDVLRGTSRALRLAVPVMDAHSLIPRRALQIGECLVHELSLFQRLFLQLPVGSLCIAANGTVFHEISDEVPGTAKFLRRINGKYVRCLGDVAAALAEVGDGQPFLYDVTHAQVPAIESHPLKSVLHWSLGIARVLSRDPAASITEAHRAAKAWSSFLDRMEYMDRGSGQLASPGLGVGVPHGGVPGAPAITFRSAWTQSPLPEPSTVGASAGDDDDSDYDAVQQARDRLARELRSTLAPLTAGESAAGHQAAISAGLTAAHAGKWVKKAASGSIIRSKSSSTAKAETQRKSALDEQTDAANAAMRRRLAYARKKAPRSLGKALAKSLHPTLRPHALLKKSELLDRDAALRSQEAQAKLAASRAEAKNVGDDEDEDDAGGPQDDAEELGAELEAMLEEEEEDGEEGSGGGAGSGATKSGGAGGKSGGRKSASSKPPLPWQASVALRSLVVVETRIVAPIEGTSSASSSGSDLASMLGMGPSGIDMVTKGTGIVVSRELGLVLVSRALCPVLLCSCSIRMHTTRIPARPVFLSPTAGFALLQFDTGALRWKERGLCLPPNPSLPALARRDGSTTSQPGDGFGPASNRKRRHAAIGKARGGSEGAEEDGVDDELMLRPRWAAPDDQTAAFVAFLEADDKGRVSRAAPVTLEVSGTGGVLDSLYEKAAVTGVTASAGLVRCAPTARASASWTNGSSFAALVNARAELVGVMSASVVPACMFAETIRQVCERMVHGSKAPLSLGRLPVTLESIGFGPAGENYGLPQDMVDRCSKDGARGWSISRVSRVETPPSAAAAAASQYAVPKSIESLPRVSEGDFILSLLPTEEDEAMRKQHRAAVQAAIEGARGVGKLAWLKTERSAMTAVLAAFAAPFQFVWSVAGVAAQDVPAAALYGGHAVGSAIGLAGASVGGSAKRYRGALQEALWRVAARPGSPLYWLSPFSSADRMLAGMSASSDERMALRAYMELRWQDEMRLFREHAVGSTGTLPVGMEGVRAIVERRGGLAPLPGPMRAPGAPPARGPAAVLLADQGERVDEPLSLAVRAQHRSALRAVVWRAGEALEVAVPCVDVFGRSGRGAGAREVLCWCGMYFHRVDPALLQRAQLPKLELDTPAEREEVRAWLGLEHPAQDGEAAAGPSSREPTHGVMVSYVDAGAPGQEVLATDAANFVSRVAGRPVPTMRALRAVVAQVGHRQSVRIDTINAYDGTKEVGALRTDYLLHPTRYLVHTAPQFELKQVLGMPPVELPAQLENNWAERVNGSAPVAAQSGYQSQVAPAGAAGSKAPAGLRARIGSTGSHGSYSVGLERQSSLALWQGGEGNSQEGGLEGGASLELGPAAGGGSAGAGRGAAKQGQRDDLLAGNPDTFGRTSSSSGGGSGASGGSRKHQARVDVYLFGDGAPAHRLVASSEGQKAATSGSRGGQSGPRPSPLPKIESEVEHPTPAALLEERTKGAMDADGAGKGPVGSLVSNVQPYLASAWGWTKTGAVAAGAITCVVVVSVVSAGAVVGLAPEESLKRAGFMMWGSVKDLMRDAADKAMAVADRAKEVADRARAHADRAREHAKSVAYQAKDRISKHTSRY